MKRDLTCIVCPMGCSITAVLDSEGSVTEISGNSCPKGAEYARNECTNPVRCVTTTVKSNSGIPVSVKTSIPVPKSRVFECMKLINNVRAELPVFIGDVIIKNIGGTGADIVATQNVKGD